jgi:hypothetical protein
MAIMQEHHLHTALFMHLCFVYTQYEGWLQLTAVGAGVGAAVGTYHEQVHGSVSKVKTKQHVC